MIRELGESDRNRWNDFVGSNPAGDVLQSWEWGGVKSAAGDWRPLVLADIATDGTVLAGALILQRSEPVIGNFYYVPRGPIISDWTDASLVDRFMEGLRERATRDKAAFVKLDPAVTADRPGVASALDRAATVVPPGVDPQGFGGTQPRCVMVLDLGPSEDDLMAACKPQCRRNIRIARKKGVEVLDHLGREALDPFYDLLAITAERDGFIVRAKSYYEALWDNLAPAGMVKLFLTRFDDVYLSGAMCFTIGDKCWYVYGASSNEHRNVMPNYAMQWSMIAWAKRAGCTIYDFRGVSPRRRTEGEDVQELEREDHLAGLNRFKEGFGARYVEYVGERDIIINPVRYWLYNTAKPAAQKMRRQLARR